MINREINDFIDNNGKANAKKYVEYFIGQVNGIFDPGFDYKTYADNLYELLRYDGYKDFDIIKGRCDKALYKYISTGELYPRFSNQYKEAFDYVQTRVSRIYDYEISNARKNNQTGSMYYNYYATATDKKSISCEILLQAMMCDISDKDFNNFIVDYINKDRMKAFSTSRKEARRAEIDAIFNSKPMSADDIKKFAIVMAILFGICWVSKVTYEARQNREKEKTQNNKPRYSYSYHNTSSESEDYYGVYDLDNNEYVIGGEDVAKL